MNEKSDIIKNYPFLGYSKNLIECFLIIGFETPFKNKLSTIIMNKLNNSLTKNKNGELDNQALKEPIKNNSYIIKDKPVILNNISSDFKDAILKEEEIINYMYPNDYTQIYVYDKNDKKDKNIKNQNLFFYLSADKILEKISTDTAENIGNKKLDSYVMFNVHGYLFWEKYNINNYIVFFPKIFVIISQYSYFKFFSYLSQNLVCRFEKGIKTEIPLEIQMYNIVRFTPSPINYSLQLDIITTDDLINYNRIQKSNKIEFFKKNNKDKNIYEQNLQQKNRITLPRLTGCPYFDIDLPFLFSYFDFETFFTIYIFSFLEFKLFFFSPNLDFINSIMYLFRFFSFPFFDNNDLGQIYSISKEDFLYGNKEIENNLIGVNCAYDEKMIIPHFYKDYMVISYNQDLLNIYFNKDIIFSYSTKLNIPNNNNIINNNIIESKNIDNDIINLIKYIISLIKVEDKDKERKRVLFLEKELSKMYKSLSQCFKEIVNNDKRNNIFLSLKSPINELKLDGNNIKNVDFKYDEYKEQNEKILTAIYKFNFSIFEYFHDMIKLGLPPQCTDTKDYKCLPYKLIIEKKKKMNNLGNMTKYF